MQKKQDRKIRQGDPRTAGVNRVGRGCNFAAAFEKGQDVKLVLYKKGAEEPLEEIPLDASCFTGNMAAVCLPDLRVEQYEYNYRVDGEIVLDPCAERIVGKGEFGTMPEDLAKHKIRCGFLPSRYNWEEDELIPLDYKDMILYKIHVRGYTKHSHSKVRHKGTFRGIIDKIPYLKELGITALELMPAYDFDEIVLPKNTSMEYVSEQKNKGKVNYWGYTGGNYYAPKPSYCFGRDAVTEMRDMVKALHKAGIACIMEFYFPAEIHSMQILSILRHWYVNYHIDGFHVVGEQIPVEMISKDPMLQDVKLLFDWVPGQDGVKKKRVTRNLAEYNEGFKTDIRRFLKSDEDSVGNAIMRIKRNPDDHAVINYISNQDGFTLADLVSYDVRHNEENGENNHDGNAYNFSWNCGVEGPTKKRVICKLREKQKRNAFLFLLLSQGVPMIYGGDEFGNSQQGNNNAWCQDNEIGWVDWKPYNRNRELVKFVKAAIAFRKEHGVFHQGQELKGMDYKALGYPDISCHSNKAWYMEYGNTCHQVGIMYCGDYAKKADGSPDDCFYVAYNFHWEPKEFALPNLADKQKWYRILDTSVSGGETIFEDAGEQLENQKLVEGKPRSISIFVGREENQDDAAVETF